MALKEDIRIIADSAKRGTVTVTVFDPGDIPGYESDIATKLGEPKERTEELLDALSHIEDDPRFTVRPVTVRARGQGSKGKIIPAMLHKVISANK